MQRNNKSERRVVLITGAGRGLGRAFAHACAAQGDIVVANSRKPPGTPRGADATVAEIEASGGKAYAIHADITDDAAPETIRSELDTLAGQLDALVLNAGVDGDAARFEKTNDAQLGEIFETNFFANVRLTRALLPLLQASTGGRLVAVSSSAGLYGLRGRAAYSASKGALNAFFLTLAQEQSRHNAIKVNLLAPYALTGMTSGHMESGVEQVMTPEAVAPMAAWLTSGHCNRTGGIWIAGGGAIRPAAAVEGAGLRLSREVNQQDRITAHLQGLDDLADACAFEDAESAFVDFANFATGNA